MYNNQYMNNSSIDSIGYCNIKYTLYVDKRSDGRNFYSLYDYTKESYTLRTFSKEKMKIMINLIGIKFSRYRFLKYLMNFKMKIIAVDSFYE